MVKTMQIATRLKIGIANCIMHVGKNHLAQMTDSSQTPKFYHEFQSSYPAARYLQSKGNLPRQKKQIKLLKDKYEFTYRQRKLEYSKRQIETEICATY